MLRGDDIQETFPASLGSLPGRQQNCCCDPESQGAHRKLPRGLLSRAFSKCGDTANCESVASQIPGSVAGQRYEVGPQLPPVGSRFLAGQMGTVISTSLVPPTTRHLLKLLQV